MEKATLLSALRTGNDALDDVHQALFDFMLDLHQAGDQQLCADFPGLIDKLERDFHDEEILMEGIAFAGLPPHRAEHAKVLAALHHIHPDDAAAVRQALQLMLQWFPAHVATLDATLAGVLHQASAAWPGKQ